MLAKLEDLRLVDSAGSALGWAEMLIVDTDSPLKVPDVEDDLARETLMYVLQFFRPFPSSLGLCTPQNAENLIFCIY
jgi:hypothetical protein